MLRSAICMQTMILFHLVDWDRRGGGGELKSSTPLAPLAHRAMARQQGRVEQVTGRVERVEPLEH